jgi:tetratricopeptide (TPR) repeat protein
MKTKTKLNLQEIIEIYNHKSLDAAIIEAKAQQKRNPESIALNQILGAFLIEKKQYLASIEYLSNGLSMDPKSPYLYNLRSISLLETGRINPAEEDARQAIKFDSNNAQYHYQLGTIHQKQSKYVEAISSFITAIELNKNLVQAFVSIGNCLTQTNEIERGMSIIKYATGAISLDSEGNVEITGRNLNAAYQNCR